MTPEQLAAVFNPVSAKVDSLHKRIDEQGFELRTIREGVTSLADGMKEIKEYVFGNGSGSAPLRYELTALCDKVNGIEKLRIEEKKERDKVEASRNRSRLAIVSTVITSIGAICVASISMCGGM